MSWLRYIYIFFYFWYALLTEGLPSAAEEIPNYLCINNLTGGVCKISKSYTIVCLFLSGDNTRAIKKELSPAYVENHLTAFLYHIHQGRPCILQDFSC